MPTPSRLTDTETFMRRCLVNDANLEIPLEVQASFFEEV
jgi:hypothetical protein